MVAGWKILVVRGEPDGKRYDLYRVPAAGGPEKRLTSDVTDAVPRVVTEFPGGQGTINVNSWSPDSRRFAYVTYEVMPS